MQSHLVIRRLAACASLAFLASHARPLGAQGAAPGSCFDRIPASQMSRVVMYLEATRPLDVTAPMLAAMDNFTASLADHARGLLSPDATTLPHGEPVVDWRGASGGVLVTARADGRFSLAAFGAETATTALLLRAASAMRTEGEPFVWPSGQNADSATFYVGLVSASVGARGEITPARLRAAVPAFSVAMPWTEPAHVTIEGFHPRYPELARSIGVSATVYLQFVVDTSGTADPTTFRTLATSTRSTLGHAFEGAARDAALTARYEPARVGPCRVRQVVQQAFVFNINDAPTPVPRP
jgi:TonB family protein